MNLMNREKHGGADKIKGSGILSTFGLEKGEEVLGRVRKYLII
jgi:hypothetical protein